jgi:lysophospholipase L1-like esterase
MNKLFLSIFGLCLWITQAQAQSKYIEIKPSSSDIYYSGRVDKSNAGWARFDWPGVGVNFCVTGKNVGIHFKGGERNYFNLIVNGNLVDVIHATNDTIFWIKDVKDKGPHRIQLVKRTEADMGQALLYGLLLDPKEKILPFDKIPERRIEFIGNSITCGYGTEGVTREEPFKPQTENNFKAYGAILSRAFNAEGRFTAHSGIGVVRNYGDEHKISTKITPMPGRFNRTLDSDSLPIWDFSLWAPHAVVINLGTNDFSTLPHPDKAVFQREYEKLILKVREVYGNIPVFCVVGPMLKDPSFGYVKEVVDIMRTLHSDARVFFVGLPDGLLNSDTDLGSSWHPSYEGQKKIAGQLLQPMSTVLKWSFDPSEIFE